MSRKLEYSERVVSTPVGGSIQLRIQNFGNLRHGDIFQTEPFELDGIHWKLMLFRLSELSAEADIVTEYLMGHLVLCSNISLRYKYRISFHNRLDPTKNHSETAEWDSQCTHAMQLMATHHVRNRMEYQTIVHPASGFLLGGMLMISAEIGHTDNIPHLLQCDRDPAFCSIEWITSTTICERMNGNMHFGVVSKKRRRRMMVTHSNATIHSFLDVCEYRVWLCDRSPNGKILIRRCLNQLSEASTFRDITEDHEAEHQWVLFFMECDLNEARPLTSDGISVIFCKLYDPETATLSYIGHILVDEASWCFHLFSDIADLAALPPGKKFNLYLEKDERNVKEITNLFASVEGNGLASGSVIVIRPRKIGEEEVSEEAVQNALYRIYAEDPSLSSDDADSDGATELAAECSIKNDDLCVVCMRCPRTAGFIHGTSMHRCVCENCAKEIEQMPEPKCPMCHAEIQHIIFRMF